jgi:hypothetical protein
MQFVPVGQLSETATAAFNVNSNSTCTAASACGPQRQQQQYLQGGIIIICALHLQQHSLNFQ